MWIFQAPGIVLEIWKGLLDRGADVNFRDDCGATPLHLCGGMESPSTGVHRRSMPCLVCPIVLPTHRRKDLSKSCDPYFITACLGAGVASDYKTRTGDMRTVSSCAKGRSTCKGALPCRPWRN
ncbi:hypothetical protein BJV78DRAFT_502650 [Lactifluus subvellereus]|nr:hypothetical protein BJV78DRAFT_502650 [Lactifluus subvellereus]